MDDWEEEKSEFSACCCYVRPEDRERVLAAGFNQHLAKPIDPIDLARAVDQLAVPESGRNAFVSLSSSASYLPGPQLVNTFSAVVEGIGRKPNSGPCRRSGS